MNMHQIGPASLDRLERLARGSRSGRFRHAPARYIGGQFFQKFIYPLWRRGCPVTAQTFWGQKMQIVLPAAMDIFLLGGKTHDSELRLTRFLVNRLKTGDRVADIGAHYGFFSLLAAELTKPGGRVEAFEAAGDTFSLLQKNVAALPSIHAHHLAISNVSGQLDFYEFPTLYTEYNTLHPEQFEGETWFDRHPPQVRSVSAVTLDAFCRDQAFEPVLIKIDVEGAEDKVVAGMEVLLSTTRPVVVMEYLAGDRFNSAHRRAARLLGEQHFYPHYITPDGWLERCTDIEGYLRSSRLDSDNLVFLSIA